MRIAILAPINRRIPPRPYGPEEQMISDITEGLVEMGHEVTLFATANSLTRSRLVSVCPKPLVEWEEDPWPDPRWWEELHVSECMKKAAAGEFDLIHNHMHVKALLAMSNIRVPVLTSLYGASRDKQLQPLLSSFREYPFVSMSEAEEKIMPDLNYVARIESPDPEESRAIPRMVERYEELYFELVSGKLGWPRQEVRFLPTWGKQEILWSRFQKSVTRFEVLPGKEFELDAAERTFSVIEGQGLLTEDEAVRIKAGDCRRTAGACRLRNTQEEPLVMIVYGPGR